MDRRSVFSGYSNALDYIFDHLWVESKQAQTFNNLYLLLSTRDWIDGINTRCEQGWLYSTSNSNLMRQGHFYCLQLLKREGTDMI